MLAFLFIGWVARYRTAQWGYVTSLSRRNRPVVAKRGEAESTPERTEPLMRGCCLICKMTWLFYLFRVGGGSDIDGKVSSDDSQVDGWGPVTWSRAMRLHTKINQINQINKVNKINKHTFLGACYACAPHRTRHP